MSRVVCEMCQGLDTSLLQEPRCKSSSPWLRKAKTLWHGALNALTFDMPWPYDPCSMWHLRCAAKCRWPAAEMIIPWHILTHCLFSAFSVGSRGHPWLLPPWYCRQSRAGTHDPTQRDKKIKKIKSASTCNLCNAPVHLCAVFNALGLGTISGRYELCLWRPRARRFSSKMKWCTWSVRWGPVRC